MQEFYKILKIESTATDEEVEIAYKELKEKYSRERFYEGEIGNEAARKLTKVETAYHEIMESRKHAGKEEREEQDYEIVQKLIKQGNIAKAQEELDSYSERDAEWHYLQSVIFYKKNWMNESKKQLEIATNMEPHNPKYTEAYAKLKQKIDFNERQFYSGNMGANPNANQEQYNKQMGGGSCDSCLSMCATWCCMDMMCSICCR